MQIPEDITLPQLYSLRTNLTRLIDKTIPAIPKDWLHFDTFEHHQGCGTYRCLAGWDHQFDTGQNWKADPSINSWKAQWVWSIGGKGDNLSGGPLAALFGGHSHGGLKVRTTRAKLLLVQCNERIAELECNTPLTP